MAGNIQNRYFLVTHTLVHIYTYNYTKGWNQLLNPSCCAYAHRYRSGFNLHSHMYILWLCVSFYCTFWLYCTMHDSSSKLWLLRRIFERAWSTWNVLLHALYQLWASLVSSTLHPWPCKLLSCQKNSLLHCFLTIYVSVSLSIHLSTTINPFIRVLLE